MKRAIRLLSILIAATSLFLVLIAAIAPRTPQNRSLTKPRPRGRVYLAIDQSFSGAPGSTIEYTVYIENQGSSMDTYELTTSSSQGYFVEVWWDTDQLNGGDIKLIPPEGSNITLGAGEVATLIVRVAVPSNAIDNTTDATIIEAVSTYSGAADHVILTTTVNSGLSYPSDWIQLGSDPIIPSNPDRVDIKALYYTNNGTHVFFRMAEADEPDPNSFIYGVYLDTKADGQQIGSYYYDYFISSDGILYEWNGTDWTDSGSTTDYQVDGTGIVLWLDLDNLRLDLQDIHVLACTATKDMGMKDMVGPYTVMRDNISEMPLVLIPILTCAICFFIFNRRKQNGIKARIA